MTRARARAIETEVTSILNDIPYDQHVTWLLPQSGMLCVLRYQQDPLGEARNNGQDPKYTEEEDRQEELLLSYSSRTSGLWPGHPAPGHLTNSAKIAADKYQDPDIRPLPGFPARSNRTWLEARPDIRPRAPDIRHPLEARTSGTTPGHLAPVCAQ
jgi:hypothetical protein